MKGCTTMAIVVLGLAGCRAPSAACSEFSIRHDETPSRLPTSFRRDVATARFASCSDGHVYSVRCRHGSLSTDCDCSTDGEVTLRVEKRGRLSDERDSALSFTNETCEWELRASSP